MNRYILSICLLFIIAACKQIKTEKENSDQLLPLKTTLKTKKSILINVDSAGDYFIGRQNISHDSLNVQLQKEASKFSEPPKVVINADANTMFKNIELILKESKALNLECTVMVNKEN